MKTPFEIFKDAEEFLEKFIRWQIDFKPTNNFLDYARDVCSVEDVFQYASILYPKFIKVEGVIVLEDHYSEENWKQWRNKCSPKETANVVNHVHIGDFLNRDNTFSEELEYHLGKLLTFFWKMAVDKQFPGNNVVVEFTGDVIGIYEK
ncbi:MAG: hypothetical protein HY818_00010 [Acetobacterium woodii]|nr:hypothetical protein [Acetobacterium woodii]